MQLRLGVPSCSLQPVCYSSQNKTHNNNVLIEQKTRPTRIQRARASRATIDNVGGRNRNPIVSYSIAIHIGSVRIEAPSVCSFAAASASASASGSSFCLCVSSGFSVFLKWLRLSPFHQVDGRFSPVKGSRWPSTCQAALFGDFCFAGKPAWPGRLEVID